MCYVAPCGRGTRRQTGSRSASPPTVKGQGDEGHGHAPARGADHGRRAPPAAPRRAYAPARGEGRRRAALQAAGAGGARGREAELGRRLLRARRARRRRPTGGSARAAEAHAAGTEGYMCLIGIGLLVS